MKASSEDYLTSGSDSLCSGHSDSSWYSDEDHGEAVMMETAAAEEVAKLRESVDSMTQAALGETQSGTETGATSGTREEENEMETTATEETMPRESMDGATQAAPHDPSKTGDEETSLGNQEGSAKNMTSHEEISDAKREGIRYTERLLQTASGDIGKTGSAAARGNSDSLLKYAGRIGRVSGEGNEGAGARNEGTAGGSQDGGDKTQPDDDDAILHPPALNEALRAITVADEDEDKENQERTSRSHLSLAPIDQWDSASRLLPVVGQPSTAKRDTSSAPPELSVVKTDQWSNTEAASPPSPTNGRYQICAVIPQVVRKVLVPRNNSGCELVESAKQQYSLPSGAVATQPTDIVGNVSEDVIGGDISPQTTDVIVGNVSPQAADVKPVIGNVIVDPEQYAEYKTSPSKSEDDEDEGISSMQTDGVPSLPLVSDAAKSEEQSHPEQSKEARCEDIMAQISEESDHGPKSEEHDAPRLKEDQPEDIITHTSQEIVSDEQRNLPRADEGHNAPMSEEGQFEDTGLQISDDADSKRPRSGTFTVSDSLQSGEHNVPISDDLHDDSHLRERENDRPGRSSDVSMEDIHNEASDMDNSGDDGAMHDDGQIHNISPDLHVRQAESIQPTSSEITSSLQSQDLLLITKSEIQAQRASDLTLPSSNAQSLPSSADEVSEQIPCPDDLPLSTADQMASTSEGSILHAAKQMQASQKDLTLSDDQVVPPLDDQTVTVTGQTDPTEEHVDASSEDQAHSTVDAQGTDQVLICDQIAVRDDIAPFAKEPTVSKQGLVLSEQEPRVSEEEPSVTETEAVVSEGVTISEQKPIISEHEHIVSEEKPVEVAVEPEISEQVPSLSGKELDGLEPESSVSEQEPNISEQEARMPKQEPIATEQEPSESEQETILPGQICRGAEHEPSMPEKNSTSTESVSGHSALAQAPTVPEEPTMSEQEPVISELEHKASNLEPAMSEQEPMVSEDVSTVSEQKPVVTEQEPTMPEQEPMVSEDVSAVSEQKPAVTEQEPTVSEQEPMVSEDVSAVSEQKHAATEQEPTIPEQESMVAEEVYTVPEPKPAVSEKDPIVSEEISIVSKQEPKVIEEVPAVSEQDSTLMAQGPTKQPIVSEPEHTNSEQQPTFSEQESSALKQEPTKQKTEVIEPNQMEQGEKIEASDGQTEKLTGQSRPVSNFPGEVSIETADTVESEHHAKTAHEDELSITDIHTKPIVKDEGNVLDKQITSDTDSSETTEPVVIGFNKEAGRETLGLVEDAKVDTMAQKDQEEAQPVQVAQKERYDDDQTPVILAKQSDEAICDVHKLEPSDALKGTGDELTVEVGEALVGQISVEDSSVFTETKVESGQTSAQDSGVETAVFTPEDSPSRSKRNRDSGYFSSSRGLSYSHGSQYGSDGPVTSPSESEEDFLERSDNAFLHVDQEHGDLAPSPIPEDSQEDSPPPSEELTSNNVVKVETEPGHDEDIEGHVVSTQEPNVSDQVPTSSEQEPKITQQETTEQEQKPMVSEQQPTEAEQEPKVTEREPVVSEQELTVSEQEPTEAEQEPKVTQQETTMQEQKPMVSEQQPTVSEQQQPTEAEQEPKVSEQEPTESEQEPKVTEREPIVSEQELMVSEQEPTESEQEPKVTEQEPIVSEQEPKVTEQELAVSEQESRVTEQEPTVSEQGPKITEQEPAMPEQEPCVTEQELSVLKQESNVSEQGPTVTEQEPTMPEQELSVTEQEPITSRQEPTVSEQGPKITEQEPTMPVPNVTEQKLSVPKQEPNVSEQGPTVSEEEPIVSEEEPKKSEQEPAVVEQEPKVPQQEIKISEHGSSKQGPTVPEQEPKVLEHESKVSKQEPTVSEQEARLTEHLGPKESGTETKLLHDSGAETKHSEDDVEPMSDDDTEIRPTKVIVMPHEDQAETKPREDTLKPLSDDDASMHEDEHHGDEPMSVNSSDGEEIMDTEAQKDSDMEVEETVIEIDTNNTQTDDIPVSPIEDIDEKEVSAIKISESSNDTPVVPKEESQVSSAEDNDNTQTLATENNDDAQISPKEGKNYTQVAPKEDKDDAQVSPKEDQDDTQVSPKEDKDDTQVSPKEDKDDTQVSRKEDKDDTQVSPKEDKDDTQVSPKEDQNDTQTSAVEGRDNTQVSAVEDKDDSQVFLKEDQDDTQISPKEDKNDIQVSPQEDKDTQASTIEDKDDTQISPKEDKDDTQVSGMEDKDNTQVSSKEDKNNIKVSPEADKDTQASAIEDKDDTQISPKEDKDDTKFSSKEDKDNTQASAMEDKDDTQASAMEDKDDTQASAMEDKDDAQASAMEDKDDTQILPKDSTGDAQVSTEDKDDIQISSEDKITSTKETDNTQISPQEDKDNIQETCSEQDENTTHVVAEEQVPLKAQTKQQKDSRGREEIQKTETLENERQTLEQMHSTENVGIMQGTEKEEISSMDQIEDMETQQITNVDQTQDTEKEASHNVFVGTDSLIVPAVENQEGDKPEHVQQSGAKNIQQDICKEDTLGSEPSSIQVNTTGDQFDGAVSNLDVSGNASNVPTSSKNIPEATETDQISLNVEDSVDIGGKHESSKVEDHAPVDNPTPANNLATPIGPENTDSTQRSEDLRITPTIQTQIRPIQTQIQQNQTPSQVPDSGDCEPTGGTFDHRGHELEGSYQHGVKDQVFRQDVVKRDQSEEEGKVDECVVDEGTDNVNKEENYNLPPPLQQQEQQQQQQEQQHPQQQQQQSYDTSTTQNPSVITRSEQSIIKDGNNDKTSSGITQHGSHSSHHNTDTGGTSFIDPRANNTNVSSQNVDFFPSLATVEVEVNNTQPDKTDKAQDQAQNSPGSNTVAQSSPGSNTGICLGHEEGAVGGERISGSEHASKMDNMCSIPQPIPQGNNSQENVDPSVYMDPRSLTISTDQSFDEGYGTIVLSPLSEQRYDGLDENRNNLDSQSYDCNDGAFDRHERRLSEQQVIQPFHQVHRSMSENQVVSAPPFSDYFSQHDTPPSSPPNTPRNTPRGKARSESELRETADRMLPNLGIRTPSSLRKSDLHLVHDDHEEWFGSTDDLSEANSGDTDRGSFEVVHFKAPEPRPRRRKQQKRDPSAADKLTSSGMTMLNNSELDKMEEELKHDSELKYATKKASDKDLEDEAQGSTDSVDVPVMLEPGSPLQDNSRRDTVSPPLGANDDNTPAEDIDVPVRLHPVPPLRHQDSNLSITVNVGERPAEDSLDEDVMDAIAADVHNMPSPDDAPDSALSALGLPQHRPGSNLSTVVNVDEDETVDDDVPDPSDDLPSPNEVAAAGERATEDLDAKTLDKQDLLKLKSPLKKNLSLVVNAPEEPEQIDDEEIELNRKIEDMEQDDIQFKVGGDGDDDSKEPKEAELKDTELTELDLVNEMYTAAQDEVDSVNDIMNEIFEAAHSGDSDSDLLELLEKKRTERKEELAQMEDDTEAGWEPSTEPPTQEPCDPEDTSNNIGKQQNTLLFHRSISE